MRKLLVSFTIVSLAFSVQASPRVAPNLNLLVYDYAGVSRGAWTQASRTVTHLLGKSGIDVTLTLCWSERSQHQLASCLEPLQPDDLVVRIMPGMSPDRQHHLGIAAGTMATVYYREALKFAAMLPASRRVPTGQILGHAIAHETGHLLLPGVPHSPNGIMRGEWNPQQLELMRGGIVHFTPEQSEAMRAEVVRRTGRIIAAGSVTK